MFVSPAIYWMTQPLRTSFICKYLTAALIFLSLHAGNAFAQCPTLIDGTGNPSANPYWVSCTGGNYTLFLQSQTAIGPFSVDFGDGSPVVTGPGLTPPAFLTHTYLAATDTFIVTLTETSTGCVLTGVVVMEVTPSASIQIPSGNPVYGCAPASFAFINASTNISETTVFSWDFGDGSPVLTFNYTNWQDTIYHTYLPGTVNCNVAVTLTAENYCNAGNPSVNTYQPIQVWDRDDAQITPSATLLCYPDTVVHFDNTTTLNCFALGNNSQRYEFWNFGDYWGLGYDSIVQWQPFNPPIRPGYNIAYPGIGSYTAMLIDSSFCGLDTAVITINIVPPPTAGLAASNDTICQGQSITFTNSSTGGANQYSWNFGDNPAWTNTATTAAQTHTFNTSGTFTVSVAANITGSPIACTDTARVTVFVKPSPFANFTLNSPSVCDSGLVTFTDASSGAVQWNWSFGNSNQSNLQNPPVQLYGSPGVYPVTLTVTSANGCNDAAANNVIIYQSPVPALTPQAICAGQPAAFSDNSSTAPGDPVIAWSWNFGDGSPVTTQASPVHTYNLSGTYNVILTVSTANCSNTDTIPVTVNVLPLAQFMPNATAACTPLNVSFTNTSTGGIGYTWDFGDGSPLTSTQSPNHTFVNNTPIDITYTVSLVVQNSFGCTDTAYQNITVYAAADASFTSNASPGCSPLPANFNNTSTGAASYLWDFGDGSPLSTAQSPSHTFVNTTPFVQNYTVTMTATSANGCTDAATLVITVYPVPNFSISAAPSDTGCTPLPVSFNAPSGGIIYQWDFGDGTTSSAQNPSHTFTNSGTVDSSYQVMLIVTSPFMCSDTAFMNVVVHPIPAAGFSASPLVQTFPSTTVNYLNTSTGATSYLWSFGDNTTSAFPNPPPHSYATWGTYTIIQTVTNQYGCTDTATQSITIIPPVPVASFTISDSSGCAPLTVTFTDASQYATSYLWDFGDGGSSTQPDPTYTFASAGTFLVTLTAVGPGGQNTVTVPVTVYPSPTAFFAVSPSVVSIPNEPVFTFNFSSNSTSYFWDFGDGTTSTMQAPQHVYANEGIYTISLIASNQYGCIDTFTIQSAVEAVAGSDIVFPTAFTPSQDGPNGGYYDPASIDNNVFFAFTEGVSEFNLMIFNRWGELIFESNDVKVGWDGYYRGKLCQQDVYVWKVKAKFLDGTSITKAGDVTLLR
jgi:gliding motility-associated-like protein